MNLTFRKNRCAFIHNSWLDPKKVRQMTVVGSRRMIVYDDTEPLEKLKVFDTRVEAPPHYDSFAEFTYSYHYGDAYVPFIKQEEPLKLECQHFLDCIRGECAPIAAGGGGWKSCAFWKQPQNRCDSKARPWRWRRRPIGTPATVKARSGSMAMAMAMAMVATSCLLPPLPRRLHRPECARVKRETWNVKGIRKRSQIMIELTFDATMEE